MALEVEPFLIAVGLMIAGAFFGNVVFRRYRLPDILFLILLGVLMGPVLRFVDIEVFRAIAPLVGTVAIIIILFDGGLKIRFSELVGGVAAGSLLAVLVFCATALLAALVAHTVAGISAPLAILLGMTLGGAGAVVVLPLIQEMDVEDRTKTVVSVEAATSDVLVVVGVVALATALQLKTADTIEGTQLFGQSLVQTFSIGIAVGVGGGFAWAQALRSFGERSYEYVLTMAALFLLYGAVEAIHGSGALAVLAFGLIVGNSRKTERVNPSGTRPRRGWQYAPVFGLDLINLHHEMVFFVRAFFFTALGVIVDLEVLLSLRFLLVGVLLSAAVVLARLWGVLIVFGRSKMPAWDRLAVTLMFPLGLAAAALSIVPYERFGIEAARDFGNYAAVVIVLTNLFATLAVYVVSRPSVRAWIDRAGLGKPEGKASAGAA